MPFGPIELLVVEFPGNKFTGELAPALKELVDHGTVSIIDILFVTKDADGNVSERELGDLIDDVYTAYDPVVDEVSGLLTHEDAELLTAAMAPNSSAGIMLFENVWAKRFADAVAEANGQVILNERIPRAVIEELIAAEIESA
ncbi:MAG TPA: DUF6325 family protein [Thermomicrobiales bacterium]|jgi:hypothetical protein|nr:hypothetical protein [Chloroflexota bacterium]HQX62947.1 DUF6325 family protein [Thermomicrobiales bacterium]HBY47478.1 hypothetical protein [Chloroflexota bacterium]HCG28267.1 hypothetical protein [Chloroflexota bacterium]HQZ90131.1 DUF6325 family protein [Thermomicrobiales bacterium]